MPNQTNGRGRSRIIYDPRFMRNIPTLSEEDVRRYEEMQRAHMEQFYGQTPFGYGYTVVNPSEMTEPMSMDEERMRLQEAAERERLEQEIYENQTRSKRRNKAVAEWSISARALKHLFTRILQSNNSGNMDVVHDYKFGAVYFGRTGMWYIHNKKSNNNIATVKVIGKKLVVRYREASFYSSVIENLIIDGFEIVTVPSSNLHRRQRTGTVARDYIDDTERGELGFRRARRQEYDREHN